MEELAGSSFIKSIIDLGGLGIVGYLAYLLLKTLNSYRSELSKTLNKMNESITNHMVEVTKSIVLQNEVLRRLIDDLKNHSDSKHTH